MSLLQDFIAKMCQALNLFARLGIVHADLKPDNIIIDYDEVNQEILELKLIDLGSAFLLTPEGHVVEN
jgi:serine/threonine protein kinase